MTTDIPIKNAVDLVLFTVVNQSELPEHLWVDGLVSCGEESSKFRRGLGLFVVTLPPNEDRYPNLKGRRVLPGGFLHNDETLIAAVERIARDKIGLDIQSKPRLVETFDDPHREKGVRVISFAHWAMVDFRSIRKYLGGKDQVGLELVNSRGYMRSFSQQIGDLDQFDGVSRFGNRLMPSTNPKRSHEKTLTDKLPSGKILALDHDEMVFYAWRQLRHAFDGKLDPFSFIKLDPIGREFRLSELQEFAEVCRGENIQRDLFRRQMLFNYSFIHPTGKSDRSKPGKPANLYSIDPPDDFGP